MNLMKMKAEISDGILSIWGDMECTKIPIADIESLKQGMDADSVVICTEAQCYHFYMSIGKLLREIAGDDNVR